MSIDAGTQAISVSALLRDCSVSGGMSPISGTMLSGYADGLQCSAELLRLARLRPEDTI